MTTRLQHAFAEAEKLPLRNFLEIVATPARSGPITLIEPKPFRAEDQTRGNQEGQGRPTADRHALQPRGDPGPHRRAVAGAITPPDRARPRSWLSPRSSSGTGRWSCGSAAPGSPTPTRRRTRSRRPSWSSSRSRAASGSAIRWAPGSIRSPRGRPRAPCRRRPDDGGSSGRPARCRWPPRRATRRAAPDGSRCSMTRSTDCPERYRVPIVLCDLEGHTCEEAARRMGRPVGTVKSWRARGRERSVGGWSAPAWPRRPGRRRCSRPMPRGRRFEVRRRKRRSGPSRTA